MTTEKTPATKSWCLYLLECRNGAFYAGITNDLAARFAAHCRGSGAKFTRANPPVRILASCTFSDRSAAARAEWAIKQLPRNQKLLYIHSLIASSYPDSPNPRQCTRSKSKTQGTQLIQVNSCRLLRHDKAG